MTSNDIQLDTSDDAAASDGHGGKSTAKVTGKEEQHELKKVPESHSGSESNETILEPQGRRSRFRIVAIMIALSVSTVYPLLCESKP